MKNQISLIVILTLFVGLIVFSQCQEKSTDSGTVHAVAATPPKDDFHGFESQIAWGQHLVIIGGCHDCHTPKKMTANGPVLDSALFLSGHPAALPRIDINRKEIESKGLAVAMDLTEWIGPWGVSFSANLTPDPTGIGSWEEAQFLYCLRNGVTKGIPGSRHILPPMPYDMIGQMTDNELKAVFAYLKSIKPVSNLVPPPVPPTNAVN
jgi:hypothetical protein